MDRRQFITGVTGAAGLVAFMPQKLSATTRLSVPDDWLVVDGSENSVLTEPLIDELLAVGVTCFNYNPQSLTTTGLPLATEVLGFVDRFSHKVTLARSVADIREAKKRRKLAMVIGWQSADAVAGAAGYSNPWAVNPTHSDLRSYYELGLRIIGICYNMSNIFGGGNLDPTAPLTRSGRLFVEEVHKLRILLDVGGHTGEQTTLDAIRIAPKIPVICTHTNVAAVVDNPRNISDRVIDAIGSTGGVIGISAVNDFNARSRRDVAVVSTPIVGIDRMIDHCDYVRKRLGPDHVALGPDFVVGSESFSIDPKDWNIFPPEMASKQGPLNYVEGFKRIGDLPNVLAALRRRGWPEADIRKLLGDNWLRVYERAWGA